MSETLSLSDEPAGSHKSSVAFDIFVHLLFFIKRFESWILIGLVLSFGALTTTLLLPIRTSESQSHICRICGLTRTQSTDYLIGFKTGNRDEFYYRKSVKKLYDTLAASDHEHEWCGGYQEEQQGNLFGSSDRIRTMWPGESNSVYYQPRLTQIAMITALKLRYAPVDLRRKVYHAIIDSLDPNAYYYVCAIFNTEDARDTSTSKKVWSDWLSKSQSDNPITEADLDKVVIPNWAFSSILHIPENLEFKPDKLKENSDYSRNWFCLD